MHTGLRDSSRQRRKELQQACSGPMVRGVSDIMKIPSAILAAMRPKQWIKNLLLFAGLIFSHHFFDIVRVRYAIVGFVLFCLISGVIYIINDIRDADSDRLHPLKCKRPIASGRLPVSVAYAAAAILAVLALLGSFALNWEFASLVMIYFVLMLAYSIWLKHVVILDLMIVAMGFVLRAIAGVKAIELPGEDIAITPWFISCILFLALFIIICKRRHELVLLSDDAGHHRPVLEHYSPAFLDQMVSVATAATVVSYSLYVTIGVPNLPGGPYLIYTLPFVLYGIFRYLFLVYKRDEGGAPESTFLQDPALIINVILWLIVVSLILYR